MAKAGTYLLVYPILILASLSTATPLLPVTTTSRPPVHRRPSVPGPELRCYPTHAPYPLREIHMADCRQLVRDIAGIDRSGKKWVFGVAEAPGVEYTVPASFSRRSCVSHVIEIESSQPASDSWTMRYLSQKVARVAEGCVERPPHLGGECKIGGREKLALFIAAAEPEAPKPLGIPLNVTLVRPWGGFVEALHRNVTIF